MVDLHAEVVPADGINAATLSERRLRYIAILWAAAIEGIGV
jgi:hypothetical protein